MHGVNCTVVLAALSLALITTHAFPDGAPWSVCYGITPRHPAGNASDAPGGYFIDSDLRDTNFFFNTTNANESQIKYTSKRTIYNRCSPPLSLFQYSQSSYSVLEFHGTAISRICHPNLHSYYYWLLLSQFCGRVC